MPVLRRFLSACGGALYGLPHALDTTTHLVGSLIHFIANTLSGTTRSTAAAAEKDSREDESEDKNELIHGECRTIRRLMMFILGVTMICDFPQIQGGPQISVWQAICEFP